MESLTIEHTSLSREDFLTGFGGSILVHAVLLAFALFSSWLMPSQTLKGSVCTVNLVSLQDLGSPAAAPKKGVKDGVPSDSKAYNGERSASANRQRSAPVVPVRKLRVDEPATKSPSEIKKLEAPDVPKFTEKTHTSAASVDQDLERLLPKPKPTPKPAPIVQNQREETTAKPSSQTTQNAPSSRVASVSSSTGEKTGKTSAYGHEAPTKGTPDGSVKGVSDGTPGGTSAQGNGRGSPGPGATGSPDGGRVASALLGMYGAKIRDLINRNWSVPETIKSQGLEVRLKAVVSREGQLEDLRVEKGSGNALFDESAMRAVRRAAPLPPLPQLYSYPRVELGLRFSPEGMS